MELSPSILKPLISKNVTHCISNITRVVNFEGLNYCGLRSYDDFVGLAESNYFNMMYVTLAQNSGGENFDKTNVICHQLNCRFSKIA